jgi:hypothetical protein
MYVIDYIMITCNLKHGRLQITSDYMKKCNRLYCTISLSYTLKSTCIVIKACGSWSPNIRRGVSSYLITCNLKHGRLQITSDYMKKCNRLQLITN